MEARAGFCPGALMLRVRARRRAYPSILPCLDDGREYLVVEDYVAGDDRNALVDRTNYNATRLLWWLAKGR